MTGTEPQHSKSRVRRAAAVLLANSAAADEMAEARDVLANFRSAHIFPMQSMLAYFRNKALRIDKNAVVARRLKRMPSILAKLRREKSMQITTMGDIGGIRIIARDMAAARQISDAIRRGRSQNTLLGIKDYINRPKPSGYRCIHHLYAYQGARSEYAGYRVELQIRSQIQHAWSTAVEMAGTFALADMKAGEGDARWLEFFRLAGVAFQDIEGGYLSINRNSGERRRLRDLAEELQVVETLSAYQVASNVIARDSGYWVLQLDARRPRLTLYPYAEARLQQAIERYRELETEVRDDPRQNIVLVAASDLRELKSAYPNYFADTALFIRNLNRALG